MRGMIRPKTSVSGLNGKKDKIMAKEKKPTKKAKEFMDANDQFKVVEGWAHGNGGLGGCYKLTDGRVFDLDLDDCLSLPYNYPKWDF